MTERVFFHVPGDTSEPGDLSPFHGGRLRRFAVDPALRPFVADLTHWEETLPAGVACTERVLPDGCLRLVAHLGDVPAGTPRLLAIGARAAPVLLPLGGHMSGWSATLRPGAAQALLDVPAAQLPAEGVALDALWGPQAVELLAQLATAPSALAAQQHLQRRLRAMLQPPSRRDGAGVAMAAAAVHRLRRHGGRLRLADLAEALGVGERRVQQLFRAHVGLSPRTLARVVRLQACLLAAQSPHPVHWADLAVDAGFSDQAHLVNEFQALCGLTPGDFLRRGVSGSSKTT